MSGYFSSFQDTKLNVYILSFWSGKWYHFNYYIWYHASLMRVSVIYRMLSWKVAWSDFWINTCMLTNPFKCFVLWLPFCWWREKVEKLLWEVQRAGGNPECEIELLHPSSCAESFSSVQIHVGLWNNCSPKSRYGEAIIMNMPDSCGTQSEEQNNRKNGIAVSHFTGSSSPG